jgi:hypothetical protein
VVVVALTNTKSEIKQIHFFDAGQALFQAILEGTSGVVSATVVLYGTNDSACLVSTANAAKETLKTYSLSGTGAGFDGAGARAASDFLALTAPWYYIWAEVTAIAGTGTAVTLTVSY